MKKTIGLSLIILLSLNNILAQDVLLEENPEENYSSEENFGPNQTHFIHTYINLGFAASNSEGDGANILYGASHEINYGIRYKLRLAEFLALGADIGYNYSVFYMKQEEGKLIPETELHKKEKFKLQKASASVFFRINYGKRGNIIGKYFDLGGYGSYSYSVTRQYTDMYQSTIPYLDHEYTIFTEKNLNYFEKINYGAIFRIGFDKFSLYGKYRVSNLFTQDFKTGVSSSELPRIEAGVELSIYQK